MCDRLEPYKPRDLFGVQLEVTSLLLDAELKKLSALQHELESTQNLTVDDQEDQQLELVCAISRIQDQVEQLEREYKAHALGALKSVPLRGSGKSNRSQPAMGLKHLPKMRPSIFGTVAKQTTIEEDTNAENDLQTKWKTGNNNDAARKELKDSPLILPPSTKSSAGGGADYDSQTMEKINNNNNETSSRLKHVCGKMCAEPLIYEDTMLISGTLNALLHHLVPTETYYPDRAFIFAYILSSRLYIKPNELLSQVAQIALSKSKNGSSSVTRQDAKLVSNIVKLLGEWADLFPYDFRDERMMGHVKTISQKCIAVDPPIRNELSQLLSCLLARLTALEKYEDYLYGITKEAGLGDPNTSLSVITVCPNPVTLAQQLAHVELDRLTHIGPEEFVEAFAKDNISSKENTKYKDLKKTRNLEFYVQWFNRLSYYVATEICKVRKKKSRVRVIEYWIECAQECFTIGNYNSLMAVIAGLNMSPVARLKKTWSKVTTAQQLSILEHEMDPTSNFNSYRSILRDAVWRFSTSCNKGADNQKIIIPFFSLLVKDLYFLNEGCASKIPLNGHINFEKFWQFAKQVTEVMAWQRAKCHYPLSKAVVHFLHTAPVFTEKALCTASYDCEAVESIQERNRLEYLQREKRDSIDSSLSSSTTFSSSGTSLESQGSGKSKN